MTVTGTTLCSKGLHEMTPDNTILKAKTPGGKKYIKCRTCTNFRKRNWKRGAGTGIPSSQWKQTDEYVPKRVAPQCPHGVKFIKDCRECGNERKRESALRKRLGLVPEAIDMAKKTSLDYLKLSPEAGKASDRLNIAIDYEIARPLLCEATETMVNEDGDSFEGYPHADFPEHAAPSVVKAQQMCAGCPVLYLCGEYGKAMRAKNQVLGGMLFGNNGKPVAE